MKNEFAFDAGYAVYPGTYVPVLKDEEVENFIHQPHKNQIIFPAVNVTELSDSFKVEVAIPGVNREDFFIHADDNVLSVCIIHKEKESMISRKLSGEDDEYECLDRHIVLPENADPEFVSAEYKCGILCLHTPKIKKPNRHLHNTIVVY